MSNIHVKVRKPDKRFSVRVQTPTTVNVSMRRIVVKNAKLEELLNSDMPNIEDGFTVMYNLASKTWQTTHIQTTINESIDLDGGSF